ncbi:MAG: hypothetical protein PWQ88_982 [Candidatus Methanomethylophilaceae archaeon]|nr:hypothetical protein [Candidatus Methanomethylophilaceae archaeon]MDI3541648.1 hypothetical protein [Candidatus Methanomethylophilaceae archaeon]
MVEYDIKRGWYSKIEGDGLKRIMEEVFGEVRKEGEMLVSSYGAMRRVEVKILNKNLLHVATEADKEVDDAAILDSKRALNRFVEAATGFNAKERMKRAQKKAKEGKI